VIAISTILFDFRRKEEHIQYVHISLWTSHCLQRLCSASIVKRRLAL